MDLDRINKILNKFKEKNILVIGDIMLDTYLWGDVKRISPEAPVQVVDIKKESYAPGGASNVASNIASLGSKVTLVGIAGKDEANKKLKNELTKRNIHTEGIYTDPKKPTIQKVRIIGSSQQLLRVDYESREYLNKEDERKVIKYLTNNIKNFDSVIVSDYAKGIITKNLMSTVIRLCKKYKKPLVVDPKPKHTGLYTGATLITPNNKEACEMLNLEESNGKEIVKIGKGLIKKLNSNILITRGENGMSLFEKRNIITHFPAKVKEVYDVTGAGDTVIATLALSLASEANLREAALLANHAAGIVVTKVGTATATVDEIKKTFK